MSNRDMTDILIPEIKIAVETEYLIDQSAPDQNHYVFAYTITIENNGNIPAKLLRRHWIITDANNKIQEVKGEGVIGLQPHISPSQVFTYSSGAILETPLGCMQGSYEMVTDDGNEFTSPIPLFRLTSNIVMH
jgi:ApaG protein